MKKLSILALILILVGVSYAYSEQGALDKIDWNSINEGTIVLLANEWSFNTIPQIDFNRDSGWKVLVPSKEELKKFLKNYEFEIITKIQDGKKVFVIKEKYKRILPLPDGLNLLPPEVQDAAANLKDSYPSGGFTRINTAPEEEPQCSSEETECGNLCCTIHEVCDHDEGSYSCIHPE